MPMVVPALLSSEKKKMQEMLDSCSQFAELIQIDIMDGRFVPSKSISQEELKELKTNIDNELHLMVCDPFSWIKPACKLNSKRIIFHLEAEGDPEELINQIKKNNMEAGVCLNPETGIEKIEPLADKIDLVLFMSVNPGFYGAPFIPEVLEKIRKFKKKWPDIKSAIDGGVKEDNFELIKNTGLDQICIGSAILKQKNPKQAFDRFMRLLNA